MNFKKKWEQNIFVLKYKKTKIMNLNKLKN